MPNHYVLPRYRKSPVEFDGELIAEVDSRTDQPRWKRIRIYHTTTGRYVTEQTGVSTVPGEVDLVDVRIFTNPDGIAEALRTRQGDSDYLTDLAVLALEAAAEHEPRIWNGSEQI